MDGNGNGEHKEERPPVNLMLQLKEPLQRDGLIDRHFHVLGENGQRSRSGKVVAEVSMATHYLVQFFEPGTGGRTGKWAAPLFVYDIADIACRLDDDEHRPGTWQFYESEGAWRVALYEMSVG